MDEGFTNFVSVICIFIKVLVQWAWKEGPNMPNRLFEKLAKLWTGLGGAKAPEEAVPMSLPGATSDYKFEDPRLEANYRALKSVTESGEVDDDLQLTVLATIQNEGVVDINETMSSTAILPRCRQELLRDETGDELQWRDVLSMKAQFYDALNQAYRIYLSTPRSELVTNEKYMRLVGVAIMTFNKLDTVIKTEKCIPEMEISFLLEMM